MSPKSLHGFVNFLTELHLSTMGIGVSRKLGDSSPRVIRNTKIVHRPSDIVQTGAKEFELFGVIELAIQVRGYRARKPLKIRTIHIFNALISSKAAERLPHDGFQKISFEELDRLTAAHDARCRVNGAFKNLRRLC